MSRTVPDSLGGDLRRRAAERALRRGLVPPLRAAGPGLLQRAKSQSLSMLNGASAVRDDFKTFEI